MKKLFVAIALMVGMVFSAVASAQTYPYSNPTYIPNAVVPQFAIASNVNSTAATLNGIGTMSLQITGTCTSLAGAAIQVSNDGTNYQSINMYPYNATTAASAVTAVTATGVWVANVAGYRYTRLTNTGVGTTTCLANMVGSPYAFALPR